MGVLAGVATELGVVMVMGESRVCGDEGLIGLLMNAMGGREGEGSRRGGGQ